MRDNLFAILLIIIGLATILVPAYGLIQPFDIFGLQNNHIGLGLIFLAVLLIFFNYRNKYKDIKECKKCGWRGPKKRWDAAGGCPICTAKKKAK